MSETVTAPDILNEIKAGRLVVVPREARNAAAPENAGDAEALRVALELMNMRQNNGTKRDDLLYEAAAFLKRRGYLVPASPDHTTALVALVEGMERERDEARALLERCRTVLGNIARENEGAIFNRWPINHEPLRADARNLLPLIEKEIGCES